VECREYKKKMPEYLAGALDPEQHSDFEGHLSRCQFCKTELSAFREIDSLINAADVQIPQEDLTVDIMKAVKMEYHTRPVITRRRTMSLLQDLVAAAAAAIIIFWFSGPVFSANNQQAYAQEMAKVNSSVGGAVQRYVNFSAALTGKLSGSLNQIGPKLLKGDEK